MRLARDIKFKAQSSSLYFKISVLVAVEKSDGHPGLVPLRGIISSSLGKKSIIPLSLIFSNFMIMCLTVGCLISPVLLYFVSAFQIQGFSSFIYYRKFSLYYFFQIFLPFSFHIFLVSAPHAIRCCYFYL